MLTSAALSLANVVNRVGGGADPRHNGEGHHGRRSEKERGVLEQVGVYGERYA